MKKILLSVCLLALFAIAPKGASAQDNPCANAVQVSLVTSSNAGNCTFYYVFNIKNDVSDPNPKGVKIEIVDGNGNILSSNCFLASVLPDGAEYPTTPFTVPCSTPFWPVVYFYTASNGECQGGVCAITVLPVSLTNFNAVRENAAMVSLSWTTLTEQNNMGFSVERNTGAKWNEIAFITSKGRKGNSTTRLDYQYTDLNIFGGISQYRLVQRDIDGKFALSPIRVVHGEGLGKNIVFPNPSKDGSVNILFSDFSKRELKLFDQTGRVVRSWSSSSLNSSVSGLRSGVYFLKIVSAKGDQSTKTIIIQ
jgi:hypothetical protein